VQAEFFAELRDGPAIGLVELDPDEAIRPVDMIADVLESDRLGLGNVVMK